MRWAIRATVAVVVAVGLGLAGWGVRQARRPVATSTPLGRPDATPDLPPLTTADPRPAPPVDGAPSVEEQQATPAPRPSPSRPAPSPAARARPAGPPPVAPEGRAALAWVGTDPLADAAWADAINDPAVPADERKNLIEDLNEDGFPDPHHITEADVPLILSRLALIEQVAPLSLDDTDAAAFAEAYKDLVNMLSDPNPK